MRSLTAQERTRLLARVQECILTADLREGYWLNQCLTLEVRTPEWHNASAQSDAWHTARFRLVTVQVMAQYNATRKGI